MNRLVASIVTLALAAPLAACSASGSLAGSGWRGGAFAAQATARKPVRGRQGHLPGELRLHVLPEATDAFILSAIANAKSSIKVQVYLLTHQGLINGLIAAKARGVDVQVMLEEKPFNPGNPNSPLPTNKVSAKKLLAGGVTPKWTNPIFKYTHAKALTVDDAVTYVSTANFTKSGLGVGGQGAREYVVEDRSPSDVAEFVAMFAADWAHQAYTVTDPDLVVSPTTSRARIFELLRSAKRDVTIQVEVAGDPALDTLIAEKVREGVKVRALLAELKKLQSKEGTAPIRSNEEVAWAWKKSGADVRWQHTPHLHAKNILVDGERFYAGSVNLTTNSMDNNRELGLIVASPDLVSRVRFVLEQDWAAGENVAAPPPTPRRKRDEMPDFAFPGLPI